MSDSPWEYFGGAGSACQADRSPDWASPEAPSGAEAGPRLAHGPSLRERALLALSLGPSTVPALAVVLDAKPNRVAEALQTALRRGEVRRATLVAPTKVRGPEEVVGNPRRRWLGAYGTRPQVWVLE